MFMVSLYVSDMSCRFGGFKELWAEKGMALPCAMPFLHVIVF
jgi:hypothetical protein